MSDGDALSNAFAKAAELSGEERRRFLDELLLSEPGVAAEVASLLDYHEDESSSSTGGSAMDAAILDRPVAGLMGLSLSGGSGEPVEDDETLPPGTLLSTDGLTEVEADGAPAPGAWTYKIVRELGRGGMGIVYEAEQAFPTRRVALKLLRGRVGSVGTTVPTAGTFKTRRGGVGSIGADSSNGSAVPMGAARRLLLEAEALGTLHDPGIAQVYAAGTLRLVTDSESPSPTVGGRSRWLFIAMELVEGPPLGEWAKGRTVREKVAVLADVCDAIEHAHRRGVVHRDVKPGNVLVDTSGGGAAPQAKVLDFGVARLTGRTRAARPDATLNVARGQLVGTLRYMSPEQARGGSGGNAVDSRSDVYSLGAVLYELLTGRPPIPVDDASIVGAVERIANSTPARPEGLAAATGRRAGADLETVLFKALEKDPGSRYQHASDLAGDLRRVLADEPITARAPTWREQFMRLVRRNRVAAAAIGSGLVLLVAGAGVATWQAVRATRALRQVREEAQVSRNALYFMERMINAASPNETRGQDVTLREMLSTAVIEVRSMPDDRATAAARKLLADALQEVGEPAGAEPLARRALAINREVLGEDDAETIDSAVLAAHIAAERGRQDEAVKEAREWRERAVRVHGPDSRIALRTAMVLEYTLDTNNPAAAKESEELLKDTVARMERARPRDERALCSALSDLSALYLNTQRVDLALPLARRVLDDRTKMLGEDHPDTIIAMGNLTAALADKGSFAEALDLNERDIDMAVRVLGPDHPSTQYARANRAQLLMRQQRFKEAEVVAKSVWEARVRRLGPDTRLTMTAQGLYISCILMQGRFDETEPMINAFIARSETLFGHDDNDTLQALTLRYDWAEGKGDKPTMEAVARRLKGTRFDPATTPQQPPMGSVPDESGTPNGDRMKDKTPPKP